MENDTTVMYFVLCLKLTSWGRPDDVTMQTSFRTQLGRPWDVSPKYARHWINSIDFASWLHAENIL